eukprot:6231485-Pyramimonas_sp.AAC.1
MGSTVAPRAFSLKLDEVLREAGLRPTQAQPLMYVKHETDQNTKKKILVQAVSAHVDDLKGCDHTDGKHHRILLQVLER